MTREEFNFLGGQILDSCIQVHKEFGPGLLESAYVFALRKELEIRGIRSEVEVPVQLYYKGYDTGKHYKIDLLIENEIVVEAKSVETLHPIFASQLLTMLKLSGKRLGYLVNFNVVLLKDGFKRIVNKF